MSRVYNFSAGPAVMPEEVLREASEEMMDYRGCGMSVMEMSHRSRDFQDILKEAEQDLRDLMEIPDNYKVLFIQGGGHMQFASGRKRPSRKPRCMEQPMPSLPARIKPSAIFQTAPIFRWTRTQTMYTSA